jgi:hypothetical protein
MVNANEKGVTQHDGSCHCGKVKFTVQLDLADGGTRCNCSICNKLGLTARNVKPSAFELVAGEAELSAYQWGSKIGTRFFCKHCGVQCFSRGYLEQIGGDFVSVNLNALDDVDVSTLKIGFWDGRHNNWQAGMHPEPWPIFTAVS